MVVNISATAGHFRRGCVRGQPIFIAKKRIKPFRRNDQPRNQPRSMRADKKCDRVGEEVQWPLSGAIAHQSRTGLEQFDSRAGGVREKRATAAICRGRIAMLTQRRQLSFAFASVARSERVAIGSGPCWPRSR